MCILRCPLLEEGLALQRKLDQGEEGHWPRRKIRRISGGSSILKNSISERLVRKLDGCGKLEVSIPKELIGASIDLVNSKGKSCPQYDDATYKEKLVFLDNGHAKLMTPFFPWKIKANLRL